MDVLTDSARVEKVLDELLVRYPVLGECRGEIMQAYRFLRDCFAGDHILFTCGNGGSAADADHIVGEIMKGFQLKRPLEEAEQATLRSNGELEGFQLASCLQQGFRAWNLMSQSAIYTAAQNDLGGDFGPAQQLCAAGRLGDVLLGISTSGNAVDVAAASQVAHMRGMKVIGMTGRSGGRLAKYADVCIRVPESETFKVQELHLPVYHALCIMVEYTFFDK